MTSPLPVDVVGPDWFDWLTLTFSAIASVGAVFAAGVALWIANREHQARIAAEAREVENQERPFRAAARLVEIRVRRPTPELGERRRVTELRVTVANHQQHAVTGLMVRVFGSAGENGIVHADLVTLRDALPPGGVTTMLVKAHRAFNEPAEIRWRACFEDASGYRWVVDEAGEIVSANSTPSRDVLEMLDELSDT